MSDTDFLALLEEISQLSSHVRAGAERIKSHCGDADSSPGGCARYCAHVELHDRTTKDAEYGAQHSFRFLGIPEERWQSIHAPNANRRTPLEPETHLGSCPFSNRWKHAWKKTRAKDEAYQQTALLRCWLSMDRNRKRLFDQNVLILGAGFAFLDQAENEVVYSTGRHGLIYLPFYQRNAEGTLEFDPWDRFKHDVLAMVRQKKGTKPLYANILNLQAGTEDLRSEFEKKLGMILAPDGEISCEAIKCYIEAFVEKFNDGNPYETRDQLQGALREHWHDARIDILNSGKSAEIADRIQNFLQGKHPDFHNLNGRASEIDDFRYVALTKDGEEIRKVFTGLTAISPLAFLIHLGLFTRMEGGTGSVAPNGSARSLLLTERARYLQFWLREYAEEGESPGHFKVKRILDHTNRRELSPRHFVLPESVATDEELIHFVCDIAQFFSIGCSRRNVEKTDLQFRPSFLGHSLARLGSTSPSCWYVIPIQAERGSQGVAAEFREVGFMLSLVDALEVGESKHFSFDPFAPCWKDRNVARVDEEIRTELRKSKMFGGFLGKIEADKVYWMEIVRHHTTREARKTAIAAIASQSLSHNIGSHALSDARLFQFDKSFLDGEGLRDFHQYLQGRMDYVAQLISRIPPQPQPLLLWGDLLREFFRQRLLLDRLVADRGIPGRSISFEIEFPVSKENTGGRKKFPKRMEVLMGIRSKAGRDRDREPWLFEHDDSYWQMIRLDWDDIRASSGLPRTDERRPTELGPTVPLPGPVKDVMVAIPGGAVGAHAIYCVLENMMRNSVKYGRRRGKNNEHQMVISMRLRDDGKQKDHSLLELWDNFSGFDRSGQETVLYQNLAATFEKDILENDEARKSGHGLVEIKEAMRFLHPHGDSRKNDGSGNSPWAASYGNPDPHANVENSHAPEYRGDGRLHGTLVFRLRLLKPRLLGVWQPWMSGLPTGSSLDSAVGEITFRSCIEPDDKDADKPSLIKLSPTLLVILDWPESEQKPEQIGEIAQLVAKHHWGLPYRSMILTQNPARARLWQSAINEWVARVPTVGNSLPLERRKPFIPNRRVLVACDPDCHKSLADGATGEALKVVNGVYSTWLEAYKPRPAGKPWHLIICFDRGREIEDRWENSLVSEFNEFSGTKPAWAQCSVFYQDEDDGTAFAAGVDFLGDPEAMPVPDQVIHFGNHGNIPDCLRKRLDDFPLEVFHFSQACGSQSGPRTFEHLYSPPKNPQSFVYFLNRLIEASLTKIVIFDERLMSMLEADTTHGTQRRISQRRFDHCKNAGVIAAVALKPQGGKVALLKPYVTGISEAEVPGQVVAFAKAPGGEKPQLMSLASTIVTVHQSSGSNSSPWKDKPRFEADIVALHEGLLEEMSSIDQFSPFSELAILRDCPRIVRFSGKGLDSRKLQPNHPVLQYSTIGSCLTPYRSANQDSFRVEKPSLAGAMMDAAGELKKR